MPPLVNAIVQVRRPGVRNGEHPLQIAVVFTTVQATIAALKEAGTLASNLGGRITLLVPQVVPYPLPLGESPIVREFNERRFRVIANSSPVETNVQIYLCRAALETLAKVLNPRSLVVIGGKDRWWSTREKRLARRLRMAGHEVVFTAAN